jgi:hypothetical protein
MQVSANADNSFFDQNYLLLLNCLAGFFKFGLCRRTVEKSLSMAASRFVF